MCHMSSITTRYRICSISYGLEASKLVSTSAGNSLLSLMRPVNNFRDQIVSTRWRLEYIQVEADSYRFVSGLSWAQVLAVAFFSLEKVVSEEVDEDDT